MRDIVHHSADKPKIFVSYARLDSSALAEELVSGLELASFGPYLDQYDIAAAEEWEVRLGALIQSADTVVFILSPAAVRSERCAWEVERALALGKRLVPVQGKPVPGADVPERLRRLNYIFFTEGQSFAKPLTELATALRQDIEWIRVHTRLTEAAARWHTKIRMSGGANDLLLRGDGLTEATLWAARRKANAPEITALLQSFLDASERHAAAVADEERKRLVERERLIAETEAVQRRIRRVQRRSFVFLGGLPLVVVLGTGTALWAVFAGWQELMINRAQFVAGVADREAERGNYVSAMLIALDALPDSESASVRARMTPRDASAWHALDGAWRVWSSRWGERRLLVGHDKAISAAAFSPDGKLALTGSTDSTARLWDAATGKPVATLAGHDNAVGAVAFSPDGKLVLTGSEDKSARLWDAATGKPVATLAGHTSDVPAVAFSPDGKLVLTGSKDNTARLWDAATGTPVATLAGHDGGIGAVAFSLDGKLVLTGSKDNTARLWDAATGKPVATLVGHDDAVMAVAFSPDGKFVLTGSEDNTARPWNATTGQPLATLAGHDDGVEAVAFSLDGKLVLTGSADKTARLWDAATGKPVATLAGHDNAVEAVAFSPDGKLILTGSDDKTARVWYAATGKPVATLAGHDNAVLAVAFSPDSKHVLTFSRDNTVQLWKVFSSAQALVDVVKTTVPRCLGAAERERFHLGATVPPWCYAEKLWPYN